MYFDSKARQYLLWALFGFQLVLSFNLVAIRFEFFLQFSFSFSMISFSLVWSVTNCPNFWPPKGLLSQLRHLQFIKLLSIPIWVMYIILLYTSVPSLLFNWSQISCNYEITLYEPCISHSMTNWQLTITLAK